MRESILRPKVLPHSVKKSAFNCPKDAQCAKTVHKYTENYYGPGYNIDAGAANSWYKKAYADATGNEVLYTSDAPAEKSSTFNQGRASIQAMSDRGELQKGDQIVADRKSIQKREPSKYAVIQNEKADSSEHTATYEGVHPETGEAMFAHSSESFDEIFIVPLSELSLYNGSLQYTPQHVIRNKNFLGDNLERFLRNTAGNTVQYARLQEAWEDDKGPSYTINSKGETGEYDKIYSEQRANIGNSLGVSPKMADLLYTNTIGKASQETNLGNDLNVTTPWEWMSEVKVIAARVSQKTGLTKKIKEYNNSKNKKILKKINSKIKWLEESPENMKEAKKTLETLKQGSSFRFNNNVEKAEAAEHLQYAIDSVEKITGRTKAHAMKDGLIEYSSITKDGNLIYPSSKTKKEDINKYIKETVFPRYHFSGKYYVGSEKPSRGALKFKEVSDRARRIFGMRGTESTGYSDSFDNGRLTDIQNGMASMLGYLEKAKDLYPSYTAKQLIAVANIAHNSPDKAADKELMDFYIKGEGNPYKENFGGIEYSDRVNEFKNRLYTYK